jgi:hypothetical protein
MSSDPRLLVLLGLRLRGFGAPEAVGEVVGLDARAVVAEIEALASRSLVEFREGRVSGWRLTRAGRAEGERLLALELDSSGRRDELAEGYRGFLTLNHRLLQVCSDWQMRGPDTLNDHADPAYDADVVARLVALHDEARPVCRALGSALLRLERYEARLAHALDRVERGERDWFTSVRLPSYHSVWFELHENLMATLGLARGGERPR